jgi:hypothetical protein
VTLVIERPYPTGIPQTAVSGFAPRGLAWHWTAGGVGRAGAEATIRHFQNTRYTVNASYHILLFRDGTKTVAMWIVPPTRASHSMNPANAFAPKTGSVREKARFTEVHRILARDNDPNADVISVSFCGMPLDLAVAMRDPVFRADVRELARQLIAHPTIIDRPHFGHGWIQPISRYETDAVSEGEDLLISKLYAAEEDMITWKPVRELWDTAAGVEFWDGDGNLKQFTDVERIETIAESADGAFRLCRYGATELLVVIRRGLTSVAGSRQPATGYGFVEPDISTKLAAARAAGIMAAASAAAATK